MNFRNHKIIIVGFVFIFFCINVVNRSEFIILVHRGWFNKYPEFKSQTEVEMLSFQNSDMSSSFPKQS